MKMGRNSAKLSESVEDIDLVWLISFNNIGFVWNHEIFVCSSVVTIVFVLHRNIAQQLILTLVSTQRAALKTY